MCENATGICRDTSIMWETISNHNERKIQHTTTTLIAPYTLVAIGTRARTTSPTPGWLGRPNEERRRVGRNTQKKKVRLEIKRNGNR